MLLVGTLMGLSLWFLMRFITRHDKFKDSVNHKLEQHSKEVKESADQMESTATEIRKDSLEIKKAMVGFEGKVNQELLQIHKKATQIEGALGQVVDKATNLKNQFEETNDRVKGLCSHLSEVQKTVEAHQNSLGLGAKAMHQHREELINMKTEIRRINENLAIISEKKPKPQGDSGNGNT
jgi:chromosome segregation ATPase